MASPFRIFRKHQKVLIVVAGVALLIVWLLGDALTNLAFRISGQGRDSSYAKEVVATYQGGKFTRDDISKLIMRRAALRTFLQRAYQAGLQKTEGKVTLAVQPVVNFNYRGEEPNLEQEVVHTQIQYEMAEAAGISISNDAINNYLKEVCLRSLSTAELNQIASNLRFGNQQVPIKLLFDELRRELMIVNYMRSQFFALTNVLPEQRWTDWQLLNDRIELESVDLPASQFLANIKEPKEAELRALYEQYKDSEPIPDQAYATDLPSPKPAFKIPRTVRLDTLEINYNDVAATLAEEVTDEEIEAYYETHKETDFVKTDLGVEPIEEDHSADDPESSLPPTSDPTAGESQPVPTTPQEPASDASTPVETPESNGTPPEPTPSKPDETPISGGEPPEPAQPKSVEYQPLDDGLRDTIRQSIASDRVGERMGKIIQDILAAMKPAYDAYESKVTDAEIDGTELPTPPDYPLDQIIEKHNLQRKQISDVSIYDLRDITPLGQSRDLETQLPLYQLMFIEKGFYRPINTVDLFGRHEFIVLKTNDSPARVPTFDQARDDIVRTWKMQLASEMALTRAKELASAVREADLPLDAYFAGKEDTRVNLTGQFAQLELDVQGLSIHLSQPYGIDAAGPEFMREVFAMEPGEVKALLNHDRSAAYVVRLIRRARDKKQLKQDFLSETDRWPGILALRRFRYNQAIMAYQQQVIADAQLEWLITPDQRFE
ncbi:MAG: hypothetical protein JW829_02090 [Pirellulales bacterium]|nr:hypothetical protein [Pirellulales bacterium]